MKPIFILLFSVLTLQGCETAPPTVNQKVTESLILPESFSYGGKMPELASKDELNPVIEWNNRLSNLNPAVGDLFGDSITWHWSDGREFTYTRDSLVSLVEKGLANTINLNITIAAALPVKYNDVGDLWVYSWIFEEMEYKDGSKASHYLHEDFRIVGGKIHEIYQFKRDKLITE